jgi:hypothetical protein
VRDLDPGLIELFVDGKEDGLPDAGRLDLLGLGSGSVVFMLHRLGWRWDACGSKITLSEDGLVATKTELVRSAGSFSYQLATGGLPMTEGRHYWEVQVSGSSARGPAFTAVGAVRPGLDHDKNYASGDCNGNHGYFIHGDSSPAYWNSRAMRLEHHRNAWQGDFAEGDRVGVLLDLDAGWMRFFRNGKRYGPGYTEGVMGPLVRAAQLGYGEMGPKVTVLPGAVAPEGSGGRTSVRVASARRGCS